MSTRRFLWLLVALLAIEELIGIYRSGYVAITALHLLILVTFVAVHGALRYGVEGTAAFAVICLVVSNLIENLGVDTGFPFGSYHYTDALGPKLGYVPLLIGPAYLGVGYLSWVLGTVLVSDVKRGSDGLTTFGAPLVGAFIMVLWDLSMDPSASTVGRWWIWHGGGGFFGVPLMNYLGWYLTVYAFMQIFALYLNARAPEPAIPQPKSYYLQATAMYAVVALDFVVNYAVKGSEEVTDATGLTWRTGDIYETSAITAIFTMLFVVVLAVLTVVRMPKCKP